MTKSANLPAPYKGVNDQVPLAVLESPFCEDLLNFNPFVGGISLRNGDADYGSFTLSSNFTPRQLAAYGTSKIFAVVYDSSDSKIKIYDVDAASLSYSSAASGTATFHTLYFGNYLYFFAETVYSPGVVYDGAAFGAIGWTGSGFNPVGGAAYNHRAYLIQNAASDYWYSGIDAVSGAVTKISLATVIAKKSTLAVIAPISISDSVQTVTYLAFVFFSGEVLFYGGSYPNSESWSIIGRASIGAPLNYNASITVQGDSLILCDSGVVSLRDLFLKGSEGAASLTVNTRIQKKWKEFVAQIRTYTSLPTGPVPFIKGVYDKVNSRVVISFSYNIDNSDAMNRGSFYFVYSTIEQAWYFHQSYNRSAADNRSVDFIEYYKNKIVMLVRRGGNVMTVEKEGSDNFLDQSPSTSDGVEYYFGFTSAPIPFPKTAVYETTQIEPILESDLYGQTNWNLIADFGRQTSGDQKTDAATTSVAKPAVNVGMQNITYVQVEMSGQTTIDKSVGLDLYSYNVWYNSGEIGSR